MWLIDTTTFEIRDFVGGDSPQYVILSHTWGDDEVTHHEMRSGAGKQKAGFTKIKLCCRQGREDGFKYAWVDTCCIDKTSSAELSEAINSMFKWYQDAAVCYVYLQANPWSDVARDAAFFRACRWFRRGWTLQELIAPADVEFYSADWTDLGTRRSLARILSEVTGIPQELLNDRAKHPLTSYSVASRLSWASARQTTRIEDRAYSLLGLFDVSMPLLYGEGENAFYRLQRKIIKSRVDPSIFAWSKDKNPVDMESSKTHLSVGEIMSPFNVESSQAKISTTSGVSQIPFRDLNMRGLLAESLNDFRCCQNVKTSVYPETPPSMGPGTVTVDLSVGWPDPYTETTGIDGAFASLGCVQDNNTHLYVRIHNGQGKWLREDRLYGMRHSNENGKQFSLTFHSTKVGLGISAPSVEDLVSSRNETPELFIRLASRYLPGQYQVRVFYVPNIPDAAGQCFEKVLVQLNSVELCTYSIVKRSSLDAANRSDFAWVEKTFALEHLSEQEISLNTEEGNTALLDGAEMTMLCALAIEESGSVVAQLLVNMQATDFGIKLQVCHIRGRVKYHPVDLWLYQAKDYGTDRLVETFLHQGFVIGVKARIKQRACSTHTRRCTCQKQYSMIVSVSALT